jgi:hypothetical protein
MAVKPLFIADMPTVEAVLRLSGVPESSDAQVIIDEGVLQARMAFVQALTQAGVNAIRAIPYVDDPQTEDQNKRMLANLTESMLVRLHLMRTLPVLFLDSSQKDEQLWNEEGLFRNKSPFDLEREKSALQDDINNNLDLLLGEDPAGTSVLKMETIGPDVTPPRPGDSIWGRSTPNWTGS